jgi:hypothetical protein
VLVLWFLLLLLLLPLPASAPCGGDAVGGAFDGDRACGRFMFFKKLSMSIPHKLSARQRGALLFLVCGHKYKSMQIRLSLSSPSWMAV